MKALGAVVAFACCAGLLCARPPGERSGVSPLTVRPPHLATGRGYRNASGRWSPNGYHGARSAFGRTSREFRRGDRDRLFLPIIPAYVGFGPQMYDYGFDQSEPPDAADYGPQPVPQLGPMGEDRPFYAQQTPVYPQAPVMRDPPAVMADEPAPPVPPIVVVLKTGQQLHVQSFAVMNGILWNFSGPVARKIPVSSIDVDASTKATEASGGELPSLAP